ncbi:MAG: TIGR03936 family radical SAM-associated protein [Clostridia bacterium]|nr:TIGR03936 family radical SAM-associated protein [Clostridia bacterium]
MTLPTQAPAPWRLLFEKKGPIRFISHLDLTRAFHRAFSRAGIPLKFSEGFSPHPKFAFGLPLSVGTESLAEVADFSLKADFPVEAEALLSALQAQMPQGIKLLRITEAQGKLSDIAFASYEIRLPHFDPSLIFAATKALSEPMTVKKKNKKGKFVEKEISSGIETACLVEEKGEVLLRCTLSASGENYIKPEFVLTALAEAVPQGDYSEKRILRTGIFRQDKTKFQ